MRFQRGFTRSGTGPPSSRVYVRRWVPVIQTAGDRKVGPGPSRDLPLAFPKKRRLSFGFPHLAFWNKKPIQPASHFKSPRATFPKFRLRGTEAALPRAAFSPTRETANRKSARGGEKRLGGEESRAESRKQASHPRAPEQAARQANREHRRRQARPPADSIGASSQTPGRQAGRQVPTRERERSRGGGGSDTIPASKTALEIAGNEGLFGQVAAGAADEPWGVPGLASTAAPGGAANSSAWGAEPSAPWFPSLRGDEGTSGSGATASVGDFFAAGDASATRTVGAASGYYSRNNSSGARPKSGARKVKKPGVDRDREQIATSTGFDGSSSSMGNYDRDYHLRMQMPMPATATGGAHRLVGHQQQAQQAQLHHRMKTSAAMNMQAQQQMGVANNASGPYFHHLLDSERRGGGAGNASNAANSLMFNPSSSSSYGDMSTAKRQRSGANGNGNGNGNGSGGHPTAAANNSANSYLRTQDAMPYGSGFQSPPVYDSDHPLPDFNTGWFPNRMSTSPQGQRGVTAGSSTTTSSGNVASHNSATAASGSASANASLSNPGANLSGIGSGLASPNGSSMFAVESLLPDYESGLYSLWNSSNGANVMGYDAENDATVGQQQGQPSTQPPQQLYMSPEEELKMEYPQLSEFNQGDLDYLCEPMESGGPSPTTPLGTSTGNGLMKMDHLVSTERRGGAGGAGTASGATPGAGSATNAREPQMERLLPTSSNSEYIKRERGASTVDETSTRAPKRARASYNDTFVGTNSNSTGTSSGFRSLARNTKMEPKRGGMPSLGSYHSSSASGLTTVSSTSPSSSAPGATTTSSSTTTITTGTKSAASGTKTTNNGAKATAKRPRSRQCDFAGCTNRARSHQKCKKHGGAHQCVFEGCLKNSQSRGLCIAHGGGSRCKVEGCVRAAQSKGLCKSHGGGEFCAVEGCRKKAHLKHLCRTHGGGVRCKFAKCSKWAQRKGWCMAHAKEFLGT